MALVQTPHDFGNHDSFQHFETGRHDQSMFFEVIMPGKDRHDGAFWCGSAALILRHALEGIGGIATETVAEDFHTTIRLHGQGWHTRYHDETLVQGLAPHDLATFLLQRDRWARGNLAVLRTPENPVVAPRLTFKQRASYLSSLLAYFVPLQRLGMLAVLVAMLVSGRLPLHATLWQFCVFWLPWMVLNLVASAALCRGQASLWDGAYSNLLTTEIFTRAASCLVHPFRTSFKVTPKDGIDDGGWSAARQLRLVLVMGWCWPAPSRSASWPWPACSPSPRSTGWRWWPDWPSRPGRWCWWPPRCGGSPDATRSATTTGCRWRSPAWSTGRWSGWSISPREGPASSAPGPSRWDRRCACASDLTDVDGDMRARQVDVCFTVRRADRAPDLGWRMGGTLTPMTEADGERTHRALPRGELAGPAGGVGPPVPRRDRRAAAHGGAGREDAATVG